MPGRVRTGRDAEGRRAARDHRRVQARGCMAKRVIHTHTHTPSFSLTYEEEEEEDEEEDDFRSAQMCVTKSSSCCLKRVLLLSARLSSYDMLIQFSSRQCNECVNEANRHYTSSSGFNAISVNNFDFI